MAKIQKRTHANSIPDIVCENDLPSLANSGDPVFLKYVTARRGYYPSNLGSKESWPELPKGFERSMAGEKFDNQEKRHEYILESVNQWITDEMLQKIAGSINELNEKENKYNSIRIVYPYPIDKNTDNLTTSAMAAVLESRLPEFLSQNAKKLPILIDVDEASPSLDNSVYTIAKGKRGKKKSEELTDDEFEKKMSLVGKRLAKQPTFGGGVDKDSLYIIFDDSSMAQSTLRNLYDFLSDKATVASTVSLLKGEKGAGVVTVQQETIDFLKEVTSSMIEKDKRGLNQLLNSVGYNIDWESPEKSTITNQEALILGSYLADKNIQSHVDKLSSALIAVNDSLKDNVSMNDILDLPKGNLKELSQMFEAALGERKDLISTVAM